MEPVASMRVRLRSARETRQLVSNYEDKSICQTLAECVSRLRPSQSETNRISIKYIIDIINYVGEVALECTRLLFEGKFLSMRIVNATSFHEVV